jgi:GNAT superfamily N-acetyltransferase
VELLEQLSLGTHLEPLEKDPRDACYARAFADIQADPRQRVVVLEVGDRVVGTGTLVVLPNLSRGGRPVGQIESVVIDESVRGRGLGQALVEHLVELARAAGCFRVQLTSNKARAGAHRFYERLGFEASHVGFKRMLST